MAFKIILVIVIVVVLFLGIFLFINKTRLEKKNSQLAESLLQAAEKPIPETFDYDELAGLPDCVQRYLKKAIPEGHKIISSARLVQKGSFRFGDKTKPWSNLTAKQTFTVNPPGFVWDATIQMAPLVKARVIDMYHTGEGALKAKIFSTITVAEDSGTPEMNTGELLRYVAEAAWFPTAYLPSQGVKWTAIDEYHAKATLSDHGNEVSLIFTFNEKDEIERVHTDKRFREVDGSSQPTPWTGHFSHYEKRNGLLIPTQGMVQWGLEDGPLPYWKGTITEVEYDY